MSVLAKAVASQFLGSYIILIFPYFCTFCKVNRCSYECTGKSCGQAILNWVATHFSLFLQGKQAIQPSSVQSSLHL